MIGCYFVHKETQQKRLLNEPLPGIAVKQVIGTAYGKAIKEAWESLRSVSPEGLLIIEHDMIPTIQQYQDMCNFRIAARVIAAPYELYPASTGLPEAVWAHRADIKHWIGTYDEWPTLFSLGFTRLHRIILDEAPWEDWEYPRVDTELSLWCLERRVRAYIPWRTIGRVFHDHQ